MVDEKRPSRPEEESGAAKVNVNDLLKKKSGEQLPAQRPSVDNALPEKPVVPPDRPDTPGMPGVPPAAKPMPNLKDPMMQARPGVKDEEVRPILDKTQPNEQGLPKRLDESKYQDSPHEKDAQMRESLRQSVQQRQDRLKQIDDNQFSDNPDDKVADKSDKRVRNWVPAFRTRTIEDEADEMVILRDNLELSLQKLDEAKYGRPENNIPLDDPYWQALQLHRVAYKALKDATEVPPAPPSGSEEGSTTTPQLPTVEEAPPVLKDKILARRIAEKAKVRELDPRKEIPWADQEARYQHEKEERDKNDREAFEQNQKKFKEQEEAYRKATESQGTDITGTGGTPPGGG